MIRLPMRPETHLQMIQQTIQGLFPVQTMALLLMGLLLVRLVSPLRVHLGQLIIPIRMDRHHLVLTLLSQNLVLNLRTTLMIPIQAQGAIPTQSQWQSLAPSSGRASLVHQC